MANISKINLNNKDYDIQSKHNTIDITTSLTYQQLKDYIDDGGVQFKFNDFAISIPNRQDWVLRGQVRLEYYEDYNDPTKYDFTFNHNKYTFVTNPVLLTDTINLSNNKVYGVYGVSSFRLETVMNVNDLTAYLHSGNTFYIGQMLQGHGGLAFVILSDYYGNPFDFRGLWLDRSDPTMAGVIRLVGGTTVGDSTLSLFSNASTISTLSLNDSEPLTVNKYFEMMGYDDMQA